MTIDTKVDKMLKLLEQLESVVVGFSGGVDSTFLAAAAHRALKDRAIAVTAVSATLPESEKQAAIQSAKQIGINHAFININELDSSSFVNNSKDRCYFCKQQRFSGLAQWARDHNYKWVLDGSNADDLSDYRPGIKAVEEMSNIVTSPLLTIGFTKTEIREVSRLWGLPTWDKPSAACLSSRVVYGLSITEERLKQIEAAEEIIKQYVNGQIRVRHHGNLARIEVSPENIPLLVKPDVAARIVTSLKKFGFTFVTLDLLGYRAGSMNEILTK
jgi:uncharacterized protein